MHEQLMTMLAQVARHYGVRLMVEPVNGTPYVRSADEEVMDELTPPPFPEVEPPTEEDTEEEVEQLRAQVQQLTAELQAAQQQVAVVGQVPAQAPAATGAREDQGIDTLGFEDEKLLRKLTRLGYDTIGKLRVAHNEAKLRTDAKLKKDWLIEVGERLAGLTGGGAVAAGANGASDVPAGHQDRPWMERLALARVKQKELDERRALHAEKEAEYAKHKEGEEPEGLDDQILELEDGIAAAENHCEALKWCMGLDPSGEMTLDEALHAADLGPYMDPPQPRIAP